MDSLSFLEEVKSLFPSNKLKDLILHFLEQEKIPGTTNSEQWNNLLKIVECWKREYLIDSDEIMLYGYLTWYLNLFISRYHIPKSRSFKDYLIRIILIESVCDNEYLLYNEEQDLGKRLENKISFLVEDIHTFDQIQCSDLVADMRHYFERSDQRFIAYKQSDCINEKSVVQLEIQRKQYMDYVTSFENQLEGCNIIRINKLSNGKEGYPYSEFSVYFIKMKEEFLLLTFTDFA